MIINKSYDPLIAKTVLQRYWWWPVLFVALFTAVAYAYLRYTKPIYESQMVIQLGERDSAKDLLDIENIYTKDNALSSVVELLRSELLFERAVKRLNLNVSLYSKGDLLTEEKYMSSAFNVQPYELMDSSLINQEIHIVVKGQKNIEVNYEYGGKTIRVNGKINEHIRNTHFDIVVKVANSANFKSVSTENDLYFVFNDKKSLSASLIKGLSVVPIDPNAKTISVSFRGHNPKLCRDITNAISESFVDYDRELKRKSSAGILEFIDSRLDSLSNELEDSKDTLMRYSRESRISDPESAGTILSVNISKLQDQLFTLEEEFRALEMVSSSLKENTNRLEVYRLMPEMMGKSYETNLVAKLQSLHDLLETRDDLIYAGATLDNPKIKHIDQKISSKMGQIQRSIKSLETRLSENLSVVKRKINELEVETFDLPEKKLEFNRLKNIQNLNEKYFNLFSEKKVLYEISDAGYTSMNRVLSSPKVNHNPVKPNRQVVYISFIILGLFAGLGVILLRYLMFNEINVVEDLEKILPEKASILGGVPLLKLPLDYSRILVADAPKSILAESMRKIRTNLSYVSPGYKTIAVSSSISGEGKTFVSMNLAGIIAMSGKRTILLDLDFRKPKIHLGFDIENKAGVSTVIAGHCDLDEVIRKSQVENLDVITAGPIPPNPSELLLSEKFISIVEELKKRYDVVLMDNPPVGLVSDGVKNLSDADIPIYVFKSHFSKRNFAMRVRELFEVQQLGSLNVILNGVKRSNSNRYGYGYGYGFGFEDEDEGYVDENYSNIRIGKSGRRRWLRWFKND